MFSRLKGPRNQFCELKSALKSAWLLADSYTQHFFELQGLAFLLEQKFRKALIKLYIGKIIDELTVINYVFVSTVELEVQNVDNTTHNAVNPETPDINVITYVFAITVERSLSYEFSKALNVCPISCYNWSLWNWGCKWNPKEQVEEE